MQHRRPGSNARSRPALAPVKVSEDQAHMRTPGPVLELETTRLLERDQQLSALATELRGVDERRSLSLVVVEDLQRADELAVSRDQAKRMHRGGSVPPRR
jgi:hypothetical protein